MSAIAIINGTADPKNYEKIEQYAFLTGLLTCSVEEILKKGPKKDACYAFLFVDAAGRDRVGLDVVKILSTRYPVVVIPSDLEEVAALSKCPLDICSVGFPFTYPVFSGTVIGKVGLDRWNERTMVFGKLEIDRSLRSVRLDGRELELKGYEYEVLLVLAEHIGSAVSRETINRALPKRRRNSYRNVDTHIKCIRKRFGMEEVIRSVRSVGYCLAVENFMCKTNSIAFSMCRETKEAGGEQRLQAEI